MTNAPSDPMIGRLIDGRYLVNSRIARGGMATVYVANDERLERRVAIKIMHGHLADDEVFKERFVQEARSAARLAHPNVVNVFDQGQDSDMAYLVMEYLPGMTLRDLLKDYGSLTTEQTLDIMDAVLGGLAAAHKAGIIHRDLKPENVLLADDGRIKIGDFGLSRATSANTATGQALLGTIAYLSPELLTRGIADERSDIYASGIMMYEMLTGEQPFTGDQPMTIAYKHAHDEVPAPSSKNATVSHDVDSLVAWATAKEPAARPENARVFLDHLRSTEQLINQTQVTTTGVQRTIVMPAALGSELTAAQTQVLRPNSPRAHTGHTGETDRPPLASDQLVTKSAERKKRGLIWLAIIVVVALLAGGTGWWFGLGPGAQITVPSGLVGQSPEQATQILSDLGFTVSTTEVTDPEIAAGLVAGSDPGEGGLASQGSNVELHVSSGPAQIELPELIGLSEKDASDKLAKAGFTSGEVQKIFRDDAPGTVLDALGADGASLAAEGKTESQLYGERQPIILIVSAGPIPDVSDKSFDEASQILSDVGLIATAGEEIYDDSIAEGNVISVSTTTDPVRPGDEVLLQISRGPEPVTVPDVIGLSWSEAKEKLLDLGFKLDYNIVFDTPTVIDVVKVQSTNPEAGESVPPGSTIKVGF